MLGLGVRSVIWAYVGMMEQSVETTIYCLGCKVLPCTTGGLNKNRDYFAMYLVCLLYRVPQIDLNLVLFPFRPR